MKTTTNRWRALCGCLGLLALLTTTSPLQLHANTAPEEVAFPELQIGTQVYTNVTVTTRNKDYVFLSHAGGLVNLRVANLSPEDRLKLGYSPEGEKKAWTPQMVAEAPVKEAKEIKNDLSTIAQDAGLTLPMIEPDLTMALVALGIGLVFYLFGCYCSALICEKAGHPGGFLVWLPVLQLFPLLRAAGMSGWWFLAFCLPLLNLVASILWCIRICKARGKGVLCTVFLLLPVTNLFAFLYLAFSGGAKFAKRTAPKPKVQMMSLETA